MATTEVTTAGAATPSDPAVLYVDDEPGNLELFRLQFEEDFNVVTAESGEAALPILEKTNIAVLLSDERMPGMRGVDLLAHAAQRWPDVVRVIVSAYGDAPRLLGAINHGHAHEYILKPWDQKELRDCVTRALAIATRRRSLLEAASRASHVEADQAAAYELRRIIGRDGGLAPAIAMATRAASSPVAVLLVGEQGTGKELIARLIHAESKRADAFMRANCRSESVATELFGSEKDGVVRSRGRLESAGRGTLFLDGVAELPMPAQAKLVRALDEGVFEREGGTTAIPFMARVIGATHRTVHELAMDEKMFSPQLKYHFNVVVPVPPLRERSGDIPALASYFAEKSTRPGDAPKRIDDAALQALATYSWPGNVRELAHIVARAAALSSDDEQVLGVDDFTFRLDLPTPGSSAPVAAPVAEAELTPREEARVNETIELRRLLLTHGGNVARAARALGVPRTTLLSRAKKLGLLA